MRRSIYIDRSSYDRLNYRLLEIHSKDIETATQDILHVAASSPLTRNRTVLPICARCMLAPKCNFSETLHKICYNALSMEQTYCHGGTLEVNLQDCPI